MFLGGGGGGSAPTPSIAPLPYCWLKVAKPDQKVDPLVGLFGRLSYGNSEDYYLSIGIEKSWVWALFVNLDFLGPKKRRGLKTRPKF